MEIIKLFEDALIYPSKEWKKLMALGILFIIMNIFNILPIIGIKLNNYIANDIVNAMSFILLIVSILIISGYTLSITMKTMKDIEGNMPEFDWITNIIDGIKVLILTIAYYIIPAIITLILLYLTHGFDFISQIINSYVVYGSIKSKLRFSCQWDQSYNFNSFNSYTDSLYIL